MSHQVGSTPVVPAQLVESPMGDKHTEKEAEATPEKEISDKKGRRHSTTPVAAPKGDSEPVETPNKSPAAKLAEMATGGGDEGAEVKKGKKRRGKKKKTDTSERSIEEQAAGAAKAVPKKDGGSGKGEIVQLDRPVGLLARGCGFKSRVGLFFQRRLTQN